jgi:RES domain
MDLDPDVVASLVVPYRPTAYLRVTPIAHRATPLGMGFGKTRFASPADAFRLLYIAEDLATSIAEAVIRDRFEGATARELTAGELAGWGVAEVNARVPLLLLDMRTAGCFLLGVSTDITGAKAQDEARQFSQAVYDQTGLDGILYLSRLTRRTCVAIYDRAVGLKLNADPVHELEALAALVPALSALRVVLI